MPLSVAEFTNRWKIAAANGSERQLYQQHFLALCELLAQPTPVHEDPTHQSYCFERHVTKAGGGKGFADVWKRGFFAWEYKGADGNLNAAYRQLSAYRDALDNPPLLVVSDFNTIRIHTAFENAPQRIYEFTLDDLKAEKATPGSVLPPLELLRALFTDPRKLHPGSTSARVTEEAAKKFLELANRLEIERRTEQPTKEQIAHFLMRIIFCLFADSIGLLPKNVFRDLVRNSRFYPTRFRRQLRDLFRAMADQDEGYFGEHAISWFNGGLFNDDSTIELNAGDMGVLAEASLNIDWAHIEPAIFGTLFERSLDIAKRSLIGAHYTSPEDILLLIEPVIMDPLRRRWAEVKQAITEILQGQPELRVPHSSAAPPRKGGVEQGRRWAEVKQAITETLQAQPELRVPHSSAVPSRKGGVEQARDVHAANTQQLPLQTDLQSRARAETLLAAWITELTSVRILDPACGSGNFLYMALRRMLDLWKEANDFAREQNMSLVLPGIVSPAQLYGIETDFYAHELSSIVVWIGFLQWKYEHGIQDEERPILRKLDNIEHADAILRYDAEGQPYEPAWPQADYIVGNPPFLGGKFLRRELGDAYVDDLFLVYRDCVRAEADLVVYWFEKARAQLEHGYVHTTGLIGTQGIRGGANRQTLQRIAETGRIFYAWSDREWTLAGAAVHISIVVFTRDPEPSPTLNGQPVTAINADLSFGTDTTSAQCLPENGRLCFQGTIKAGAFDIDPQTAHRMLTAPVNPNGRPNSDVVRRWVNGTDVTRRDRGMFIIDFGVSMQEAKAALYELPFEYIRAHVKPLRNQVRRMNHRERWWIHGESRPGMRKSFENLQRYIITPRVSKYRLFTWLPISVLPDSATYAFARDDDYFFGILHSSIHELWARAQGTQLREVESGFRYTPNTTFDTFPFPWPPGTEPKDDPRVQAIASAAKTLVDLRDRWLNPPDTPEADLKKRTLTNLYNTKPQWLQDAHRTLDQAVFAAYNWLPDLTDQQILEHLLTLNHQRAKALSEGTT